MHAYEKGAETVLWSPKNPEKNAGCRAAEGPLRATENWRRATNNSAGLYGF